MYTYVGLDRNHGRRWDTDGICDRSLSRLSTVINLWCCSTNNLDIVYSLFHSGVAMLNFSQHHMQELVHKEPRQKCKSTKTSGVFGLPPQNSPRHRLRLAFQPPQVRSLTSVYCTVVGRGVARRVVAGNQAAPNSLMNSEKTPKQRAHYCGWGSVVSFSVIIKRLTFTTYRRTQPFS
jgi:hypothetical protein